MIEILRLSDLTKVTHYPHAVIETIRQSIVTLNEAYGADRTRNGDGGLELIVESEDELSTLLQTLPYGDLPEFAEVIHQDFLHAVYVVSDDRTIDVFLSKEWATQSMLEVMKK